MSQERKLRKFIREEIRAALHQSGSNKERLDESVMGITDMPAVNSATSFQKSNEDFSYDPNAVSQMADRDRKRQSMKNGGGNRMARSSSDTTGNKTTTPGGPGGPDKTGFDKNGKRIVFEDTQSSDRVSLWIEGNNLVCEYKSETNGTQKTKLSEQKTREVIESILEDNFQI